MSVGGGQNLLGEAVLSLRTDQSGLDSGIAQAKTKSQGFVSSAQSTLQGFGDALTQTGQRMTLGVTTPVIGMGLAILKTAANFESSMNRVGALTNATGAQFESLGDLAKKLGADTAFSASEAADAMGFLAQAGFSVDEITAAMPATLQLAAAGQLDLARAAEIAGSILAGYGMEASDLARVNDILAKAANATNTDIEGLGLAFSYAGPIAKSAGLQFEEVAAAVGLMGNAGFTGERAGTALRAAMGSLLKPVGAAKQAIEDLGLQTTDSSGQLLPLVDIMRQLEDKGATTADVLAIFGLEAGPAMAALLGQGSDALAQMTDDLGNAGGEAQRVADANMKGLNGALQTIQGSLETLMLAIAESGLLEWATRLVLKAAELINVVTQTDSKLLRLGVIIAGLAAAIGPALLIAGQLVGVFALMLSPLGLLALAVGALGAAFALNLGGIRELAMPLIDSLVEGFGRLQEAFDERGLMGVLDALPGVLASIASSGLDFAGGLLGALAAGLLGLDWSGIAATIGGGILSGLTTLADWGLQFLGWVAGQLAAVDWTGLAVTIGTGLIAGLTALPDFGMQFLSWVSTAISAVDWTGLAVTIGTGLIAGLTALPDFGMQFLSWVSTAISAVDWSGLAATISAGLLTALTTVADFGTGVATWLQTQFANADLSAVGQTLSEKLSAAMQTVQDLGPVQSLIDLIATRLGPVLESLSELLGARIQPSVDRVREAFSGLAVIWSERAGPLMEQLRATGEALLPALQVIGVVVGAVLVVALTSLATVLSALIGPVFEATISLISIFLVAVETIAKTVANVVDLVSALLRGDWSAAWDAAQQIVIDLVAGILGIITHLKDAIITLVSGMVDAVIGFFQNLYHQIVGGSLIPDLVNGILQWIGRLPGEVAALISDMVSQALTHLGTLLTEGLVKAGDLVTGILDKIGELLTQGPAKMGEVAAAVLLELGQLALDGLEKAGEFRQNVLDKIAELITQAPTKIIEMASALGTEMGNLATEALGWGSAIVQGIIDGMASLAGSLAQKASDLANAAKDAVTGVFDILSPSRVMRQIGVFMVQGWILGLGDEQDKLRAKTLNISRMLVEAVDGEIRKWPAIVKGHLEDVGRVLDREQRDIQANWEANQKRQRETFEDEYRRLPGIVEREMEAADQQIGATGARMRVTMADRMQDVLGAAIVALEPLPFLGAIAGSELRQNLLDPVTIMAVEYEDKMGRIKRATEDMVAAVGSGMGHLHEALDDADTATPTVEPETGGPAVQVPTGGGTMPGSADMPDYSTYDATAAADYFYNNPYFDHNDLRFKGTNQYGQLVYEVMPQSEVERDVARSGRGVPTLSAPTLEPPTSPGFGGAGSSPDVNVSNVRTTNQEVSVTINAPDSRPSTLRTAVELASMEMAAELAAEGVG